MGITGGYLKHRMAQGMLLHHSLHEETEIRAG